MSSESERAAAYRAMMASRAAKRAARERALGGNNTARRALQDAWQPVLDPLGDMLGDDPYVEDDCHG